ncbi:MAG: DUF4112 domain-containing protein [Steroidobacteraceae bacterium]
MSEPEFIPREEAKDPRLAHLSLLAFLLDRAFRVPGTNWRFGLDALIGLVPGLGDVIGSMIGGYSIWIARQLGAPSSIQLRMALNLAIDGLVGLVPLLGDAFDFAFKAHTRNQALLTNWLERPHSTHRSSLGVLVGVGVLLLGICAAGAWLLIAAVQWIVALF